MTIPGPTVIAVDARVLTQTGKGVPRFLYETLRALSADERLRVVLFSNRPLHPSNRLPLETVIDARWRLVPGTVWMLARLNGLAARVGATCIWGPAHMLPFRRHGLRTVLTVHDLVHHIMPRSMGGWNRLVSKLMVDRSIHAADQVVSVSHSTARHIVEHLDIAEELLNVVRPGVRKVVPRSTASTKAGADYLFVLGSIEPRKNIGGLLDCFAVLRRLMPNLSLRLAGGHSWGSGSTLARLRDDPACEMLGFLSDAELTQEMWGARAFVMPSHYEGFGLPVLEAVGLAPIIASDIPVFRELGESIDGIHFVDFGDRERAANSIAAFLAGHPPPAQFRPGAGDEFDWKMVAQRYAAILSDRHARRRSSAG